MLRLRKRPAGRDTGVGAGGRSLREGGGGGLNVLLRQCAVHAESQDQTWGKDIWAGADGLKVQKDCDGHAALQHQT